MRRTVVAFTLALAIVGLLLPIQPARAEAKEKTVTLTVTGMT